MKVINKLLLIVIVLCALCSCNGEDYSAPMQIKDGNSGQVVFSMYPMTRSQIANTQVYVFNGEATTDRDKYVYRVPGINYADNVLSMIIKKGTWNLVLVNGSQAALGQLVQPTIAAGVTKHNSKMWETVPVGGVLPSVPELMTAHIDEQIIVADQTANASASMARNVAMVKVVIKDAGGLTNGAANHKVSLTNVPTTLSWAGGLLPDKDHPTVNSSLSPMSGGMTISPNPLNPSSQVSDTVTFIIPAHKGFDFLSANPTDTTTCNLKLSVDFGMSGGGRYQKSDVIVPVTPKSNKILVVNLIVKAQLTVETQVLDWVEKSVNANISQTSLLVSKTNVGLSYKDTVIVNTNAADFTIQNGAPGWITAEKLDAQRVVITANTESYSADRSSYINIVANNITKRINVTQRPDVGTISVSAPSFWVSPITPTRTITVNSTGPWEIVGTPQVVTPGISSGNAGTSDILFTRKSQAVDNGDYSIYGNSTVYIRNKQTLEVIPLESQNLYMVFYNVTVGNAQGTNTTVVSALDAICLGGSGSYTITSKPDWLTSATLNPDGTLTLVAQGESTGEPREGSITFTNSTDPTYTITTTISQDVVADFEPFSYFVLKFTWNNITGYTDVDIDVYFENNYKVSAPTVRQPWDLKSLGYGKNSLSQDPGYVSKTGSVVKMGSKDSNIDMANFINLGLLFWGGDNTSGGGESIFFNAPMVDNDTDIARFVKLVCKVWFYNKSSTDTKNQIRTSIYAYEGGTMTRNTSTYNFNSSGGTFVYGARNGNDIDYNFTNEEPFNTWGISATITYDKLKHSAKIVWGTKTDGKTVPVPINN